MTEYQQARDANQTTNRIAMYHRLKRKIVKIKKLLNEKRYRDILDRQPEKMKEVLKAINELLMFKRLIRHQLNQQWLKNERIMQGIAKEKK
jgi:hypothetical protein